MTLSGESNSLGQYDVQIRQGGVGFAYTLMERSLIDVLEKVAEIVRMNELVMEPGMHQPSFVVDIRRLR